MRYVLGTILVVYIGTIILLNIPYIQQKVTALVADELSKLLRTEVSIGKINMGLMNRIIIDDVLLDDQSGKEMLKVTRLSAKFDLLPLFRGKITIGSVQLFGFNINLNKPAPGADPNFKFVLDAFASKDTVQTEKNIDLRINSILIRRGRFSYDVLSEEETPGKFNPQHIKLYNIIANISLKALQSDSINAQIKRLSVDEQSGLELQKLSLKVLGNPKSMCIENFGVDLPGTSLRMDTIRMNYDSLEAFKRFITDVRFSFKILPSHITLQDISPFVPALAYFKEKIELELEANGTIDQLICPRLVVNAGNHVKIRGDVALNDLSRPQNTFIFGKLSNLSVNKEGVDFLLRNFSRNYSETPPLLKRLGDISFNGEISGYFTDLVTYGSFRTELGLVKADVKLSSDKSKENFSYSGRVKTEDFEFGKWLDNEERWGKISFNVDIQSNYYKKNPYPSIVMKGSVDAMEFSGYKYENIVLDGEYKQGGFNGKVALDDINGSFLLNGNFNLIEKIPTFNFLAEIKNVRPHELHLTPKYKDSEFSMKLKANFTGGSIDEMIGRIDIDSVLFTAPDKQYYMDNMEIIATRNGTKNLLTIQSKFLNAKVEGNYSYRTIASSITNMAKRYVPSLFTPTKKESVATNNNFSFDIHIFDTEILPIVFDIPLNIYSHSTLKGYFNDNTNRLRLEGYFPRFRYGNTFIESGMILCENPADQLRGRVRFSNLKNESTVSISLEALAKNDELITRLNWGNSSSVTYSGDFQAQTNFSRITNGEKSSLRTVIDVKPTNVILNDTVWEIHPSQIVADSGRVHIHNFYFSGQDQFIRINGLASDNINDTVKVDLKDINIGYVFDIINLKSVDFKGLASGSAIATRLMSNPIMSTRLFVKDFSFNDGLLGDMDVSGEWDQKEEGIRIKAHVQEKDIAQIDVKGYIYPIKPKSGIDLHITPSKANLKFLEFYTDEIVSDIKGRASGYVRLFGPFSALNLEGRAKADATFKINVLNTYFSLRDSVRLSPEEISFKDITFSDMEDHQGKISTGYIRHKHFKDMSYRFDMNVRNMLVMNTTESFDMPFYGSVYATGSASLVGDAQQLNVNAAVATNRNTNLIYTMASSASATSNQFVKFVDKTANINLQDSIQLVSDFEKDRQSQEEDKLDIDIRLNIQVDATPDANIKIIMDPISGDYISGKGWGNIRAEYYNKGDVRMFGNYNINQGVYKFSLQEVIRKDFGIKDGSSISFNGNPSNGSMDVQAVYTVSSASLNDLIPQDIIKSASIGRTSVRVNCMMNLSGILLRPTIKLAIELPNERDEVQTLVRNYISTDEEINMQMIYLLAIGKFYTPDYVNAEQNSNMMTSVLSSTLSGQLNNMLTQIINNNNWSVGTNLSTGEKGWTDMEVEGILSGQLLNNRLLINGNFGYRDNPMANTNFVGDFQAEWLLTRSGDIRLKAYSETNDRYYTRTNLTTQGFGIMYKKDFNKWRDLFFWQNWKPTPKKPESEPVPTTLPNDSIIQYQPRSKEKREN